MRKTVVEDVKKKDKGRQGNRRVRREKIVKKEKYRETRTKSL